MKIKYTIEILEDEEEGGFVARVRELPGCMTCADTISELGEMIADAIELWQIIKAQVG